MGWRDDRLAARQTVHETFKVSVRYVASFPYDSNSGDSAPTITARIHDTQKPVGASPGAGSGPLQASAFLIEAIPKAIFFRENLTENGVTLARGAVIVVSATEAYHLDALDPHDHETISAHITRLTPEELVGLPVPDA